MNELQKESLAGLADLLRMSPEIRLGQLMAHLGFLGETHVDKGLGTLEDDELLALIYRHRSELEARQSSRSASYTSPDNDVTSISGSSTTPTRK